MIKNVILASDSSSSVVTILYIFAGVITFIVFICIVYAINNKKNQKVIKTSPYIAKIEELNKQFVFKQIPSKMDKKDYNLNTKRQFDNFDFENIAFNVIRNNFSYYNSIADKLTYNSNTYALYKKELSLNKLTMLEDLAKENGMSLKSYNKRELKLGKEIIITPVLSYTLRIAWEYTSPAGRNHYSNYQDYNINGIKAFVIEIKASRNISYADPYKYSPPTSAAQKENKNEKVYSNDDIESVE